MAKRIEESEKHLRALSNSVPQIVWTANVEGVLNYTNDRAIEYLEPHSPADWLSFVHDSDKERVTEVWLESIATGNMYEIEFRIQRASVKSFRWHLVRAYPTRNAAGEIDKWIGLSKVEAGKMAIEQSEFLFMVFRVHAETALPNLIRYAFDKF